MFGQSKSVSFEPYGRRRRSGFPRWLALLLIGLLIGAAGVIVVQERYMPPRLSADASVRLRNAYDKADAERQRLKGELDDIGKQLAGALADAKTKAEEAAAVRASVDHQREDTSFLIASLPPDPRAGDDVQVRAVKFDAQPGTLAYDMVLTRERATKPLPVVMQFVVAGDTARGSETTVTLKPVTLSVGSQEIVHGSVSMPTGFRARQVTIQILDHVGGKFLGMRVMLVK
jgi:hypothetical protein